MDRDAPESGFDFAMLADPMKAVLTCEHGRHVRAFGVRDVAEDSQ